jgi:hypothetical protein
MRKEERVTRKLRKLHNEELHNIFNQIHLDNQVKKKEKGRIC